LYVLWRRKKKNAKFFIRKPEGDHWEALGVDGSIPLKRIFNQYDGSTWAELIWFMIGTSGGLL